MSTMLNHIERCVSPNPKIERGIVRSGRSAGFLAIFMKSSVFNKMYVERKKKVFIEEGNNSLSNAYLATALKNLESYGFTFSQSLFNRVSTWSEEDFVGFYQDLLHTIKEMVGANVKHNPLYPNFPKQVMEAREVDLFINALFHGFSLFIKDELGAEAPDHGIPGVAIEERVAVKTERKLITIDLGTEEEFYSLIRGLIGANTSISESDKKDIDFVIAELEDVALVLPASVPNKENMAYTVGRLLRHQKASEEAVRKLVKTATDVLRLAVGLSEGDVSLGSPIAFTKFKRSERRLLLALLEKAPNLTEDMLRFKGAWKALGTILHPREYKSRYPKANAAFDVLRSELKYKTFEGKVEEAIMNNEIAIAVSLLKARPGEFARRLDRLLSKGGGETVIQNFQEVAEAVSTPVLLQVMTHFKHRNDESPTRTFFPKGNVAKMMVIENKLPPLPLAESIVEVCQTALRKKFSTLPSLGKVYLDEDLEKYMVPFNQRSASKSLHTVVRGSKLPMPADEIIRLFLYWREGEVKGRETGSVDIDASFVFYDEQWQFREHISFTHLRSEEFQATHSGDVRYAPEGASEFIDIHVPTAVNNGARYVVMSVNSYSEQPFCDLPECFAGWMGRSEGQEGEIYEPTTVEQKFDLSANTRVSIPVVFDLVESEATWLDLALAHDMTFYNTVESTVPTLASLSKSMMSLKKTNLLDLFSLHAAGRGEIVRDKEDADTIFSVTDGVTPFDIETIMSEYLA